MKGLLITLEGIDGCGKTTVLGMISGWLMKAFPEKRFVFTAEPTSGDAGKLLRQEHLSQRQSFPDEFSNCMKAEELCTGAACMKRTPLYVVYPLLGILSLVALVQVYVHVRDGNDRRQPGHSRA